MVTDLPWEMTPRPNWRQRIEGLSAGGRAKLAARARRAPLFAHAYAFHLNFRFGGMKPLDLAEFAKRTGSAGPQDSCRGRRAGKSGQNVR